MSELRSRKGKKKKDTSVKDETPVSEKKAPKAKAAPAAPSKPLGDRVVAGVGSIIKGLLVFAVVFLGLAFTTILVVTGIYADDWVRLPRRPARGLFEIRAR